MAVTINKTGVRSVARSRAYKIACNVGYQLQEEDSPQIRNATILLKIMQCLSGLFCKSYRSEPDRQDHALSEDRFLNLIYQLLEDYSKGPNRHHVQHINYVKSRLNNHKNLSDRQTILDDFVTQLRSQILPGELNSNGTLYAYIDFIKDIAVAEEHMNEKEQRFIEGLNNFLSGKSKSPQLLANNELSTLSCTSFDLSDDLSEYKDNDPSVPSVQLKN